ncbi:MAG: hypothetical protein HY717_06985 [Planctomycetes bacterium]|nr:hypothetical protein [Planctomycetota bacterium]
MSISRNTCFFLIVLGALFLCGPWACNREEAPKPAAAKILPLLAEVEPADSAAVQGTEAWIRWRSPVAGKGKVLLRKAGEQDFRGFEAMAGGEALAARLAPLEPGGKYEYRVETAAAAAIYQSALRTFEVKGGLAFNPASLARTIHRDYDQAVLLELENRSLEKVTVAARALAHFADLPADLVGPGSADQPAELPPGGSLKLRLAIAAADAARERYEIPVEAGGVFATVRLDVARPKFQLAFKVTGEDPQTLAKSVEIRNEGEALADLNVRIASPNEAEVRLQPDAQHAYLQAGEALQFLAMPVLYLEFQSLKVEMECASAGQSARFPLEFQAPPGKRLIGVRAGTQERTENHDWYCSNKPTTCSEVSGPDARGPDVAAVERMIPILNPNLPRLPAPPPQRRCAPANPCAQKCFDEAKRIKDLATTIDEARSEAEAKKDWKTAAYYSDLLLDLEEVWASWEKRCREQCGVNLGVLILPSDKRPSRPGDADEKSDLKKRWLAKSRELAKSRDMIDQMLARRYKEMAEDPPAADFAEAAEPDFRPLPAPGAATEAERLAWSIAELRCWEIACLKAYQIGFERWQGARQAGDRQAMALQAEAMQKDAELALEASRASAGKREDLERRLLPELEKALEAAGDGSGAGQESMAAWRKKLAAAEAPAGLPEALRAAGLTEAEVSASRDGLEALSAEPARELMREWKIRHQIGEARRARHAGRKSESDWPQPGEAGTLLWMAHFASGLKEESPPPAAPKARLRPGLLEALGRRASFTRDCRGPFASPVEGDAADSSDRAACWHDGDRVSFAWHQNEEIFFAVFDPRGQAVLAPQVLGQGRWPRLAAGGKSTAAAWSRGDGSVVRRREGERWSEEMPLSGREAALRFAPDGSLHAATTTGLWKLAGERFERVQEAAYSQPALGVDGQGRLQIAWRRTGRIACGDADLGEGERPALAFSPEGVLHLAYLSRGSLLLRSLSKDGWTEPQAIPAANPSWPALAAGSGGVRLTFLGDAARGPAALWLVRPGDQEPVLVPSLAGNVTAASLLVKFDLRYSRSHYRPHDIWVAVNDVVVGKFDQTLLEGRYLYRLDPYQIFTSSGRPVFNRVGIRSWHMNGGHYAVNSEYQLITRTSWSERYGFAESEEALRSSAGNPRLNHDQPDLALLANRLNLPVEKPQPGVIPLAVSVANLGEAASPPERLVLSGGEKDLLAQAEVPALQPGEENVVMLPLSYDGRLERAVLRLEPKRPDFDPRNDILALTLWERERGSPPAGLAGDGMPGKVVVKALDSPEPPFLCRFLEAGSGKEAARMERGRLLGPLPPGRYRLAITPFQYEGKEVLFPGVLEHRAEEELRLAFRTAIQIEKSEEAGRLWRWEAVKPDRPEEAVQWQQGEHPLMLLPPGEYRIAVQPAQYASGRTVLSEKIAVEEGQVRVVPLTSGIKLDMPAASGPLFHWEAVDPGNPGKALQWQKGDLKAMVLSPGAYQVAIQPSQYGSGRLVLAEKIEVMPDALHVLKLRSGIKIEMPKEAGQLFQWEAVEAGKPHQRVQWQNGDLNAMVLSPGAYQVAIQPTQYSSERLVWPEKLAVQDDQFTVLNLQSGIRLAGPEGAKPEFECRFLDAETRRLVQSARSTWNVQLLPPGRYRVEVRKSAAVPWKPAGDPVQVDAGKVAEVKLAELP